MTTIPIQTIPTHPIPPSGSLNPCCHKGKRGLLATEMKNARRHFRARARTYGGVAVINSTNCPSPEPGEATPRLDRLPTVRVETTKTGLYWATLGSGRSGEERGIRTRKWMLCAVQPNGTPRCRGSSLAQVTSPCLTGKWRWLSATSPSQPPLNHERIPYESRCREIELEK